MSSSESGGGRDLAYAAALRARQTAGLEKGRRVREANAVVRKMLREGTIDPQRLIAGTLDLDDPVKKAAARAVARWRVDRLLIAIHGIGPAKQHEILASMRISPGLKLAELRQQRREELARFVGLALARRPN